MSPWRESLVILGLLWSVVSTFGQFPSPSTSTQWKALPLTDNNPGFDGNSGGQKVSPTIGHFRQIHRSERKRRAAENVGLPGKPEGEFDGMIHDDTMTHGMNPTGVMPGVELENMDTSERLKTDEQSELFQSGKRQRMREKTSGRRWRQNGVNFLGKSKTSEREGTMKWGENGLGFPRGKQMGGEKKERRKWGANTLSVWGKRNDREKQNGGCCGEQADDSSEESRPEADGSKPEMTKTKSAANYGRQQRNRRSIEDIDWFPASDAAAADAAVSYLSKRSKPRRRSLPAPYGGPKRTWETNTMKVWGKRSGVKPTWEEYFRSAEEPINGKRKWTTNNAIRIWGKRDRVPPPNDDENYFPFSRLYDTYES